MDNSQDQAAFSFELRILKARNSELNSTGNLFVRCYMSSGNKKSVQFQSQEVSSSKAIWNQSFSLDCFGTTESMSSMLSESSVIFELRQRSTVSFFGRTTKSQLLGKAEVPWKNVMGSTTMEIEKWVVMTPKKSLKDGLKPPAVQIGMKVGKSLPAKTVKMMSKNCGGKCECKSCVNGKLFALDAALEFSC